MCENEGVAARILLDFGAAVPLRRYPKPGTPSRLERIEEQLNEIVQRLEAIERRLGKDDA